jgi:hypothetical protein
MNLFTKRFGLVLAGVVGVGAVATLAMGASFALFSSNVTGTPNTFSAGSVTLTANSSGTTTCADVNLAPGDSSPNFKTNSGGTNPGSGHSTECTAAVNYTGTLGAFIGVDYSFTSVSGLTNPSEPYDATTNPYVVGGLPLINSQGLSSTNAQTQFEVNVTKGAPGYPNLDDAQIQTISCSAAATATTPETCTGTSQIYIMGVTTDTSPTIALSEALDYYLPSTAGNLYQGSSLSVTLNFESVQADNNTNTWNGLYTASSNCPSNENLPPQNSGGTCPASWS